MLANILYSYRGMGLSVGTMIAGWDEKVMMINCSTVNVMIFNNVAGNSLPFICCCELYRALVFIMWTVKEDDSRETDSLLDLARHMLMVYWIAGMHHAATCNFVNGL